MSAGPNALRLTAVVDPLTSTARFPQIDKVRFVHLTADWEKAVQQAAAASVNVGAPSAAEPQQQANEVPRHPSYNSQSGSNEAS